jgi:predicted cupin superfamily sugar epimerase
MQGDVILGMSFTTMTARQYIDQLKLQRHPEGGFYKETYRSSGNVSAHCLPEYFGGSRSFSTAIYYLLQQGDFSAFHRIKSDECWHFYAGETLLVHVIETNGTYYCIKLGNKIGQEEQFQFVVPAGAWFASEPAPGTAFALAGCTVAPGFDFADFEMAGKEGLLKEFPRHHAIINRLCR